MITPWTIIKLSYANYRNYWKEILLFTSLMTLSSVMIFILYFIRAAYPVNSLSISFMFWIFLPLLTLNLLFMYVNFIHFLYNPQHHASLGQLFKNWRWDIILKTFWLFLIFVMIFSVGFTFPLLILNTLINLFNNVLLNILYWIITGILIGLAIMFFNYLQFAYTLAILRKNDNIKTVLRDSYLLIKNRWWNALFNQVFVILLTGSIFKGLMNLFITLYPNENMILIKNNQLQIASVFLVSYLLIYTILIFMNLNLTLSYNLEFFKIYEKTKKVVPATLIKQ